MIKFLIKKSFYDGWDNLVPSFIYNIACMVLIALYVFIVSAVEEAQVMVFFGVSAVFLLLFCIYNFGVAGLTYRWSHYEGSWGPGFIDGIRKHIPHILVLYLIAVVAFFYLAILFPAYFASQSFFGFFIGCMSLWVIAFIAIASQYYIPLCFFLDGENPFFIIKQCFVLTMDNLLFTLFVSIKTVFDFLLSALSFFFIPGLSFISLSHMDAVKLLHLRYRWAKEHSCPKKDVNIKQMLEEENANIGERTIRNFFRPWKNDK